MKRGIILLGMTLAVVFYALPVNGALITVEIEAVVDSVWDAGNYLDGNIKVGDIITGWYTYDSDTPDSNPSAIGGRYEHHTPPHGIFLSVGGFDFQTDLTSVDFLIEITNNYPPGDDYFLLSRNNVPLYSRASVYEISWWLYDPTGSALSSTALPENAPVLAQWGLNDLRIQSLRTFSIAAHVTSAVPEPTTILSLGLGALLLRKRK